VSRSRGAAPDRIADTVSTSLAAVIGILEASRDGGSAVLPTYPDSLLALTVAADRVVRELLSIRPD
jgi:hypothetical protein